MRAYEILESSIPPSKPITLRALHKLKHDARRREAFEREKRVIMRVMYADPAYEQEQLELERLRLELEQLKAEIAATNVETEAKSNNAISSMALSGIEADKVSDQEITKLAKQGLGRRKKRPLAP